LNTTFTNSVVMAKRIEQGIRSDRIFVPTKKKRFEGKKKDVDYIEGGYKDKKNHNTLSNSSQIANKTT